MLLICQHCDYKWDYQGETEHYATCPRCRYKVKMPEDKAHALRQKRLNLELRSKLSLKEQPVKLLGIAGIVNNVIEGYKYDKSMLIQILLELQKSFGWLPMEMLLEVSKQLGIPLSQVYQVATFYKAFSLAPRGRHLIRVCMGTSCNVRGAPIILDRVKSLLGIESGETTPDLKFTLDAVKCMGCSALGPLLVIDQDYYGSVEPEDLEEIVSKYK